MIRLPRHIALDIRHNDHATSYQSVEQWLANENPECPEVDDWVSPDERAKAIATGEVWECVWYPRTMVGSCRILAATLEALLAALAAEADGEGERR